MDLQFRPGAWLRWTGALAFLAGAVGFLIEGWTEQAGIARSLAWSAVTLSLALLGIVALKAWRDATGARLFLGLSAATIPVHFAQLGAQTYGLFVENTVHWVEVVAAALALALLAPVLALGVASLVRRKGVLLTCLLFAWCAPLLWPSRSAELIAAIACTEVVLLLGLELLVFAKEPTLQTKEGAFARSLLLFAPLLLLVRNAFYPITPVWQAAVFAVPGVALLGLPMIVSALRGLAGCACQAAGTVLLVVASAFLSPSLAVFVLSLSGIALVSATVSRRTRAGYAWLALLALGVHVAFTVDQASFVRSLFVLVFGLWAAQMAFRSRRALAMIGSAGIVVAELCVQTLVRIQLPTSGVWLFPVAAGTFMLLAASYVEKRRPALESRWAALRAHFAADHDTIVGARGGQ